jgi:hypothetical protein
MGLDAKVYCNCFEIGRLKQLPPEPALVYVCPDGSLNCRNEDLEVLLEFDEWLRGSACEHKDGVLLHYRIGNIALVGLLREELKREATRFPVLLEKVLYNGVHAGDCLSLDIVIRLQSELKGLAGFAASGERNQAFVGEFKKQMQGLVDAALSIRKPISF